MKKDLKLRCFPMIAKMSGKVKGTRYKVQGARYKVQVMLLSVNCMKIAGADSTFKK
jgi:hypothetical protein